MRTKIYTKGGDKGETSMIGGPRVSKANLRLDAYGTVDELNAYLGLAISCLEKSSEIKAEDALSTLHDVQNELFCVGSQLACVDESFRASLPHLSSALTQKLENEIDIMTASLPELKDFILPGGHETASHLHVARTICRRAERITIELFNQSPDINEPLKTQIISFINRLSDYLFTLARHLNLLAQTPETKWKK